MASELFVDNITGKTGTSGGAPITLSGDTATLGSGATISSAVTGTLGSGVTFPAGHILQVKEAIYSTQISKSDTNTFDIITVDITPASTSNKVLVWGVVMGVERGTVTNARLNVILTRDSTEIHNSGANFWTKGSTNLRQGGFTITKLDSPSTTSQITYKLQGRWPDHSSPSYVNKDGNSGNSTITVMEIAG